MFWFYFLIYSRNYVPLKNYDIFHNSFNKPAKSNEWNDNPFGRFRQQLFTSLYSLLLKLL